jgi:hypothetical protein
MKNRNQAQDGRTHQKTTEVGRLLSQFADQSIGAYQLYQAGKFSKAEFHQCIQNRCAEYAEDIINGSKQTEHTELM